jgi:hypothetical protein
MSVKIGDSFGRWVTIKNLGFGKWICKCSCGKEKEVYIYNLIDGKSLSCGCLRAEQMKGQKRGAIHGMTNTTEFRCWSSMRERCLNKNHSAYHLYGGRGISICIRWNEFINFFNDMGVKPSKSYSLDRINNNGNYEPGNCRWATWKEQAANKRFNQKKGIPRTDEVKRKISVTKLAQSALKKRLKML